MTGVRLGKGVAIASVAAGPLLVLVTVAGDVLTRPSASYGTKDLGALIAVLLIAAIFGALVAVLPNLWGAMLLGALGRGNVGTRVPPFWALTGAAAGGIIGCVAGGESGAMVMAVVGAACALACRSSVRWAD